MCGRYVRYTSPDRFAELFGCDYGAADIDSAPSYNVAPSQRVLAARAKPDGGRELAALKWGLLPAWSREPKTPYSTINARAETVAEKPFFRSAFRHRRCLIAADGFYEWRKASGHKQPYFVSLAGHEPFAFAGLWEHWQGGEGQVIESCAIIVTEANALMRSIHDRMPVILAPGDYELWLDPAVHDPRALEPLLRPFPAERMRAYPVSAAVNSPRNQGPELLEPLNPAGD
jgi:putative SOS response-associated peptidase YedK